MQLWHLFLLVVTLVSSLAGCSLNSNNQAIEAQAAQLSGTVQNTDPTAPTETPAITGPAVSTDRAVASTIPPVDCPVTRPPDTLFVPPAPYLPAPFAGEFWYGTDALWTAIPAAGVWAALPHNPEGYTQKVFWWRKGYFWKDEPEPQLVVTGRRLDKAAPPLNVSKATNAFAEDIQSAMLVGVDFPTFGCWEISGRYRDAELSFVIWIAP
jgi:hypothetical protein